MPIKASLIAAAFMFTLPISSPAYAVDGHIETLQTDEQMIIQWGKRWQQPKPAM